jgi:hypothetical protein
LTPRCTAWATIFIDIATLTLVTPGRLRSADHELADGLELALAGVSELHFHGNVAAIDPHVTRRARGHEVLARVGVDHGPQDFGYLFNGETQDRLRF